MVSVIMVFAVLVCDADFKEKHLLVNADFLIMVELKFVMVRPIECSVFWKKDLCQFSYGTYFV